MRASFITAIMAAMTFGLAPAAAEEPQQPPPSSEGPAQDLGFAGPAQRQGWTVDTGAAVVVSPFYEGGEDYRVLTVPYARASFGRDRVSISFPDGLRYNIQNKPYLSYGVGLNVGFGRDEEDDRILRGLGDVDRSFGPQVFGSLAISRRTSLSGSLFADIADGHGGITASTQVNYFLTTPGPKGFTRVSAGLEFADDSYNETLFGISDEQAANSAAAGVGLPAYEANGGLNRVTLGLFYLRPVAKNVSFIFIGSAGQLVGDAADSPIVQQDTAVTSIASLAYRF